MNKYRIIPNNELRPFTMSADIMRICDNGIELWISPNTAQGKIVGFYPLSYAVYLIDQLCVTITNEDVKNVIES